MKNLVTPPFPQSSQKSKVILDMLDYINGHYHIERTIALFKEVLEKKS